MADQRKTNVLVIWGDDIGQSNLSCFTKGVMGYRTPNIDRIANDACSLRNTTPSARPAMIKQRQAALR